MWLWIVIDGGGAAAVVGAVEVVVESSRFERVVRRREWEGDGD